MSDTLDIFADGKQVMIRRGTGSWRYAGKINPGAGAVLKPHSHA